jgi:hypothetical protein
MAGKLAIRAQKPSVHKRLRRFLADGAVRARQWYHPMATWLGQATSRAGHVHLIIDGSKVSAGHQLLMVGIAYRGRPLPLAWAWVKGANGHSTTYKQIRRLSYVQGLIRLGVKVSLVGDSEFGCPLLIEYLDQWGRAYALRQPGNHRVVTKGDPTWPRLNSFKLCPGPTIWIGRGPLTRDSAYPTNFLLYWQTGEIAPWFVATNLVAPRSILRLYRRRVWIEELLRDMKSHGLDLEVSRLRHFLRSPALPCGLSRLRLVGGAGPSAPAGRPV